MVSQLRQAFNKSFSNEKYDALLQQLNALHPEHPCAFRVAETPVFIDDSLAQALEAAGAAIIEVIRRPDFKELTERSIPERWRVAGEEGHPHFLTFDFAVSEEQGALKPKLIEMQGFPSLYGFQSILGTLYKEYFDIPDNWDVYFNGLDQERYLALLRRTIIDPFQTEEVVLMDVHAPAQKTAFDFFVTRHFLGIPIVSLHELIQKGKQLFYKKEDGSLQRIRRIYNRLIFDELEGTPDIFKTAVDIRQDLDVDWMTHPHWFYRISKFILPFIQGDFNPKTEFLHKVEKLPQDLQNYVLKPLFSFAGQGVIIDVTEADINNIPDPENWILQEKVSYAPAVQSPEGGVKCEIRLMYLWPDEDEAPTLAINLMRLSRGKMVGVRYNSDFNWVGGTVGFMRQ